MLGREAWWRKRGAAVAFIEKEEGRGGFVERRMYVYYFYRNTMALKSH